MNSEEVKALVSTLNNYASGAQHLPAHIAAMLKELRDQLHADSSAAINEANRTRHDEDEKSQRTSVVDRGRTEIEVRWAKETIGLVANDLSRAYTEIEITRDGHTIPGGLGSIANRLNEAMQRLGLVNHGDLDSEIPF